jgi:AAA+ superfamily predicted ATPase
MQQRNVHGQPGTGMTLTAMYLAGRMRNRTVVLLTGRQVGLIPRACAMARRLQPSMVILEDVDLIAEARDRQQPGCTPLLFELLNEMDGLGDDADVIFLLTSNRPDLLEPALAARPGRVDLAVEVPLPDAGCRRLIELYGHGLTLRAARPPPSHLALTFDRVGYGRTGERNASRPWGACQPTSRGTDRRLATQLHRRGGWHSRRC